MAITLFIIGILLLIFLCKFSAVVIFQLKVANYIKNNIPKAIQSYCILELTSELTEFQNKLFDLIDNLLDVSKTIKIAISFKKINLQCFLTDKEIEFLKEDFNYE